MSHPGQPLDPHGRPINPGTDPGTNPSAYGAPAPPPPWQAGGQPQPWQSSRQLSPAEERNWAMAAHVGSFVAAWVALGLLAPLLVMVAKGDESRYVRRHAVESLNFQLSVLIYSIVGGVAAFVLAFVTLGLGLFVIVPLILVFALAYVVLVIVGTLKASHGDDFRYPLTMRLVS